MANTTTCTKRVYCHHCDKTINVGEEMVSVMSLNMHKRCDEAYNRRQGKRQADRRAAKIQGLRAASAFRR